MRYFVTVSGREHEVDITRRPDGSVAAAVGGRPVALDAVNINDHQLSVRVGDRVVDLTIEGAPPKLGVVASGHRSYIEVESERMRMAARAQRKDSGAGAGEVRSPMPGRVVKVLVNEGDAVATGQAVVIVEAMKMENEVRARAAATVSRVHVAAGKTVEANAVLVSLTPLG